MQLLTPAASDGVQEVRQVHERKNGQRGIGSVHPSWGHAEKWGGKEGDAGILYGFGILRSQAESARTYSMAFCQPYRLLIARGNGTKQEGTRFGGQAGQN